LIIIQTIHSHHFQDLIPKATKIRKSIIEKDSLLGVAFAKHFDLKFEDLPMTLFLMKTF
jgi:hypothetical protein